MTFKNRSNEHIIKRRLSNVPSEHSIQTTDDGPLVLSKHQQEMWCESLKKKLAQERELGQELLELYAHYSDMWYYVDKPQWSLFF